MSGWIDAQIALDSSQWSVIPPASVDAKGNTSLTPAQQAFFSNAINGPDQLRQRVAFALSELFVVSGVKLLPEAVVPYLQLLQQDAFTTYDKLLYDVTLSPGMGHYLDMVDNDKVTPNHSPDENYAREVLQLFSIGLVQLDNSGTPILDANGNQIPTYDQNTIEGFAAAFTGWTYAPLPGAISKFGNPVNWGAPMVPFENNHDMSAGKTLLNGYILPANQTAELDLADTLANIFQHQNVAPFICRQLIQHLVTSNPSPAYVNRISTVFNASPRGNLGAVVKAILLDPEARAGDMDRESLATKLREPALGTNSLLRGLNATVSAGNALTGSVSLMGQPIYYPPTVFSYFLPGYEINLSASQTYNAPEFQLLSEATATATANFVNTLSFGTIGGVTIDLSTYVNALGTNPASAQIGTMVDSLSQALMGGAMPSSMRNTIVTAAGKASTPKAMVQTAVYLIGSSWQYQVEQ
jgi:uncharacterized protein (DUF1800 family)